MISIAIYRESSGIIDRVVSLPYIECPVERKEDRALLGLPDNYADAQCDPSDAWVETHGGVDSHTHYVNPATRTIHGRTEVGAAATTAGLTATIHGVPAGMTVSVGDASLIADGDPVEIEFDAPGRHRIEIGGMVEYMDETMEVTVG